MTIRYHSIDVAKGLGMLLVVLGHNWIVLHDNGELFRIIFSFHMPLFFFLSGIFLKESVLFRDLIASKADAILKPYFFIMIVLGGILIIFRQTPPFTYLTEVLYGTGDSISLATRDTIAMVPIWFLPHLFIASLFTWATLRIINAVRLHRLFIGLLIATLMVVGSQLIELFHQPHALLEGSLSGTNDKEIQVRGLPFSIDLVPATTAFMLIGYLIKSKVGALNFHALRFTVAVFLFSLSHYFFDETIDLNSRLYGNPIITFLQAMCGIYIILSVSTLIQQTSALGRYLAAIGSGSLFILMFHQAIQSKIFAHLSRFAETSYLNGLVAFILGVAGPLVMLTLVRRHTFLAKWLLPRASR